MRAEKQIDKTRIVATNRQYVSDQASK